MLRERIECGINAGGDDMNGCGTLATSLVGKEGVASNDRVHRATDGSKATQPARIMQTARVVRIAQIDGVVEIEEEMANLAAQEPELPPGQQAALDDDGVEFRQVRAETQPAPQRARIRNQVEDVPRMG